MRKMVGDCAEDLAMSFLLSLGYKLLARNWRSGHKELDLVFEDAAYLRVVEVRCRACSAILHPVESIGDAKRVNIIRASDAFVRYNGLDKSVVFDVISVLYSGRHYFLEYIPDAFTL